MSGVKVRSELHPGLIVAGLGRFVDGELEVTALAHLPRLRRLAHLGVVVPDDLPDDAPPTPPKGNAGAKAWGAYADSLGVAFPAGAKRDEIQAAIAAATAPPAPTENGAGLGDEGDHVDADDDLGDDGDDQGDEDDGEDQGDEDADKGDAPAVATETDW